MKYEPKDGILTISEWDELENYILDDLPMVNRYIWERII